MVDKSWLSPMVTSKTTPTTPFTNNAHSCFHLMERFGKKSANPAGHSSPESMLAEAWLLVTSIKTGMSTLPLFIKTNPWRFCNESQRGHWLALRFLGTQSNRRGIGVHVTVQSGSKTQINQLCGGTSYASAHQPQLNFGLGTWDGKCTVKVRWPSGKVSVLNDVVADRLLEVRESE